MKDISKSAGWPANYPAFTDRDDAAPAAAAEPPPPPAVAAPPPAPAARLADLVGRVVDLRVLLLIVLVGLPALALCVFLGR